jgi:hypothetical protein
VPMRFETVQAIILGLYQVKQRQAVTITGLCVQRGLALCTVSRSAVI